VSSDILMQLATALLGGGAGAYAAIRVELRWLRRDVDAHSVRLDEHDERLRKVEVERHA
jgi:hypothetical protein